MILAEATKGNEVIVRNKYYPEGLREQSILKHYQQFKKEILSETFKKPVILLIATNVNEYAVKRNYENGLIYLDHDNYDKLIHGRTISMFSEIGSPTNVYCVDIDPGYNVPEEETKVAVGDVLEVFNKLYEHGWLKHKGIRITSTSRGYHVYGFMKRRDSQDNNLEHIRKELEPLKKKYLIDTRRKYETEIVLDLSPMKRRGSHVVPYALNRNGLMCMDVTKTFDKFKRQDAIIKGE